MKDKEARSIFARADKLLQKAIKKELRDQGHRNTGNLENSFASEVRIEGGEVRLIGTSALYSRFLNDGVPASSISFKQFPFYVEYFLSKGFDEKKAKAFAAASIRKSMSGDGMPTKTSVRFSKNGRRRDFIGAVEDEAGDLMDKSVSEAIDIIVDRVYLRTKNETI